MRHGWELYDVRFAGVPQRLGPHGLCRAWHGLWHEYEEWRVYPLVIPLAGMVDFKVVDLASGLEGYH